MSTEQHLIMMWAVPAVCAVVCVVSIWRLPRQELLPAAAMFILFAVTMASAHLHRIVTLLEELISKQ